jgi:sigma-E factor negative regulatory protein RseA
LKKGKFGIGEVKMMNAHKMSREQISALADNELADSHVDVALAALRQPEEQSTWDVYHQIGDVLRSEDMAIAMRPDFSARMAARLAAEPVIIAPAFANQCVTPEKSSVNEKKRISRFKRFGIFGAVAAAAASVAVITTPQLMVAMKGKSEVDATQITVATSNRPVSHASIIAASAPQSAVVSAATPSRGVVLRDPHIDEYLRAHQRFSPSIYSSAQFARSATLAHESEK